MAAEEEDGRPVGRPRRRPWRSGSSSTPLNRSSYSPPTACSGQSAGRPRTPRSAGRAGRPSQRTPGLEPCGRPTLSPAAWKVPTIGACLKSRAVWVAPGAKGSCRWRTSKCLVAQRPDGAELGRRVGGERGHRAVGRGRDALAERRDAGVGRRAVAGAEHPRLVAEGPQRRGPGRAPGPAPHRGW